MWEQFNMDFVFILLIFIIVVIPILYKINQYISEKEMKEENNDN